jgi:hypothetical protein
LPTDGHSSDCPPTHKQTRGSSPDDAKQSHDQSPKLCRIAENVGLFQKRTSAHTHLVDLRRFPRFDCAERVVRGGVAQWAVLSPA